MKVLPKKEFVELATSQKFTNIESMVGFIDRYTHEPVVLRGVGIGYKLHELGHQVYEHQSKAEKFFGKGKKNVLLMREPWTSLVDDEIEAELYRFRLGGKKITPRAGLMAIYELLDMGWKLDRALGLVVGRLRKFGIQTSWEDRKALVDILRKSDWDLGDERLLP